MRPFSNHTSPLEADEREALRIHPRPACVDDVVAAAIDSLWSIILDTLIWINPFRMIYDAVNRLSGGTFADGMTGGHGSPDFPGPLQRLADVISDAYFLLVFASWEILLPLFLGFFFLGLLMFKNMNRGSALKKLLIRFVFIVIGIPLLGSLYSGTLNAMKEATSQGNSAAAQVVLSTYVDFEAWAKEERLRVPSGAVIAWSQSNNAPTGEAQAGVQETALLVNSQVMGFGVGNVELGDGAWGAETVEGGSWRIDDSHHEAVLDLLKRYMDVEHINASSIESGFKSTVDDDQIDAATDWFEEYTGKPKDLKGKDDAHQNPLLAVQDGAGLTSSSSDGSVTFSSAGVESNCGLKVADGNDDGASPAACNLSPLALYNYLNTDFGPTSYTSYSSGKSTSEATRTIHNSVNLVGTGLMGFVYWINAVVLLGAFVIIGLGYALGLVIANLRRTFQLIMAIPFAALGVISGIAKVIVYTVAMLMEILVTIFMYMLVQQFLLSIPKFISAPFAGAIAGEEGSDRSVMVTFLVESGALHTVVVLVSIIMVILFTILAMRMRKTLVKAVEDTVTKLVEKFTDPKSGPSAPGGGMKPGKPSGGGKSSQSGSANRSMGGASTSKGPKGSNAGGTNSGDGPSPKGAAAASSSSNDTKVSGDVDTDGKLEGPDADGASGSGGSGAGLDPSDQERDAAGEAELGRRVEEDGLSDSPMETAVGSAKDSTENYLESDKKNLAAGTDGAKAVGHAGAGVIKGVSGDGAGAADEAGKTVNAAGSAQVNRAEAGQAKQRAEKSTLDNPQTSPKYERRIQQGQQAQQAGSTVSNVAGVASSTGGGGAPKSPQPQKTPKKPSGGRKRGPKRK